MRTTKVEVREKFFALLTNLGKDTVTKSEIKEICSTIGWLIISTGPPADPFTRIYLVI